MFRTDPAIENRVEEIARAQFGLVSIAQLLEIGLSESWARHRAARGKLKKAIKGVYAFPGVQKTYAQRVLAGVLSCAPSVASHFAAMWLWEMGDCDSNAVEISTERQHFPKVPGIVIHRSVFFLKEEQVEVSSVPCTTYARTLIDVSARFSLGRLGRMLDSGLRSNKLTLSQLRRCSDGLYPGPGRKLSRIHKLLAERLPGYDPGDSDLEVKVLRWIVEGGIPEPVQQHPVCLDGHDFRLDLSYPDVKLVVEADGFKFHIDRSAFDHDRLRSNLLVAHGWRILRFTSTSTREHVVATVAAALGTSLS